MNGIVQGVGFRPYVYNLAVSLGLAGWVSNTSSGVDIELEGEQTNIDRFLEVLRNRPPTLSRVDTIDVTTLSLNHYIGFEIRESRANSADFLPISPDMSICPDCQRELFDPSNRRYRYPFINCTNCGPRFSIIRDIPYDRPFTTMAGFSMCDECCAEYNSPSDRRYHAQPIACENCGPRVRLIMPGALDVFSDEAIRAARKALKDGKILAIKGLGGYHLACDAKNSAAVNQLRERKHRTDKPFALMCFSLEQVGHYAEVTDSEALLLDSPERPIVLLPKKTGLDGLNHIAPSQNSLGFMLSYTPLHLLLLEPGEDFPDVFVMTSGNLSEEPIAYLDDDAQKRLSPLADAFLIHDRPIHMRVDDSVVRVVENRVSISRRARGYAPSPLKIAESLPQILACGAELKNTFSLSRDHYVFVSHHIGDLENIETKTSYEQAIEHYKKLYRISPEAIAVDLHPDYLSTRYGLNESKTSQLPLFPIQHHHAHLASCLGDNDYYLDQPVIGLIFDGTGYGTDGRIWGGEALVGGYKEFSRPFHLEETPLPGGDSAIRNPAKIALAYLHASRIDWESGLPPVTQFKTDQLNTISRQLLNDINCPKTSSMGRLFDAVSSLLGICHHITYEAQAAIELENLCDLSEESYYKIPISAGLICSTAIMPQIIMDMRNGISIPRISARFHNGLARISLEICHRLRDESGLNRVALSGGVWQNTTLLAKTLALLRKDSFDVMIHQRLPTNDGGVSFGQLLITAELMKNY